MNRNILFVTACIVFGITLGIIGAYDLASIDGKDPTAAFVMLMMGVMMLYVAGIFFWASGLLKRKKLPKPTLTDNIIPFKRN